MKSIAIVIPAHNEERTLGDVLEGLVRQDRDGLALDVVVVNDGSRDRTPAIAAEYASRHGWIRLLTNEKNLGLSGSLKRGIAETKGDVVITLHADIVPHRADWLKRVAREFEDPKVGAVGCTIHSKVAGLGFIDAFFLEAPPRPMLGNKSDAYSRAVLEELGGFDTSFRVAGEDVDLGSRIAQAGYEVRYADGLDVDHLMGWHQMGFKKHLKKEVQYAEVQPRLYRRHGYMTTAIHAATLALLVVNGALLAVESRLPTTIAALNASLLLLALVLARKHRLAETAAFAAAYFALGAAASAALGFSIGERPATAMLLGVAGTQILWGLARSATKARRLRDARVLAFGLPLFLVQDLVRGWGALKGARGFFRG